jgi:hypothetical protein
MQCEPLRRVLGTTIDWPIVCLKGTVSQGIAVGISLKDVRSRVRGGGKSGHKCQVRQFVVDLC